MNQKQVQQLSYSLLFLVGFGLFIVGIFLLVQAPVMAESLDIDYLNADYVGERECASCHGSMARDHQETSHGLALFEADNQENIVADFTQDTPLLTLQLPTEDSARKVMPDDIAYVVGAGVYAQRYLIEDESGNLLVLPIEWDVAAGEWQAFTLAEIWSSESYNWNSNCAYCHTTGFDVETSTWQDDGVQCEACHGAGSYHVDVADKIEWVESDEDRALIANSINLGLDAQVCGQCHSQGTTVDSGLPYPVGYMPSMNLESSFNLAPITDTSHWWRSGHASQANMQYNEWLLSGHGDAFSTLPLESQSNARCLVCHSEGYRYTERVLAEGESEFIPASTDEAQRLNVGITCATCHDVHDTEAENAYLRDEPDALCTECHRNGELDTVHHPTVEMLTGQTLVENVEAVVTAHSSGDNAPTCTTCHMMTLPTGDGQRVSHTFSPVMPGSADEGQTDACTSCHTDLTASYGERFITQQQDKTERRILEIQSILETGEYPIWIYDAVNFVAGDGSLGIHNVQYTEALLDSVEQQIGLTDIVVAPVLPAGDPTDCAECHADEHREWLDSPHANASLASDFQNYYATIGQPGFCLRCHASGYDPQTQTYQFEGVVCTNCHAMESGAEHPPAPIDIADNAEVCGTCHSGGHASVYEEWLTSQHSLAGVDCVDCHKAHDNSLILGDVNSTCSDCHADAMNDEVHMGAELICTDCHMTPRQSVSDPTMLTRTGHDMNIDTAVCADCHGSTHSLTATVADNETVAEIDTLNDEVERLESVADQNLSSGLIGGAIGVLLLLGLIYLVLRLGRSR